MILALLACVVLVVLPVAICEHLVGIPHCVIRCRDYCGGGVGV